MSGVDAPRILVVGAGAIGGVVGAALTRACRPPESATGPPVPNSASSDVRAITSEWGI